MVAASIKPSLSPPIDPDNYRMSIGEHLEELRKRLILGITGFVIVLLVCVFFGQRVVDLFCDPLIEALTRSRINPQLVVDELSEGFMVYIRISAITALALASPWIVFQLWLFVAAGLYPHERKYITRYVPLSITLLCTGMLFVYFLVLPWTLRFFVEFNSAFSIRPGAARVVGGGINPPASLKPLNIPMLAGDPASLRDGDLWFDTAGGKLKFVYGNELRVIGVNSSNLLAQEYKLSDYIDLVVMMLITFGVCFQLPLLVLALQRTGIVELDSLRRGRRPVYFALIVAAAVITPGDTTYTTILLFFPLMGLYELGILLASMRPPGTSDDNMSIGPTP